MLSEKRYFLEIGPVRQKLWSFKRTTQKTLDSNFLECGGDQIKMGLTDSIQCRSNLVETKSKVEMNEVNCSLCRRANPRNKIHLCMAWVCSVTQAKLTVAPRSFNASDGAQLQQWGYVPGGHLNVT